MDLKQAKGIVTGRLGPLPCPENSDLVRCAAAEGTVLLENSGILPLKPGKVALFGAGAQGTMYCGTGSGYVFTSHPVTVAEGLKKAGFTLTSAAWLERCANHEKAVNKADRTLTALDRKWSGVTILAQEPEITPADLQAAAAPTAIYIIRRNAGECNDRKAEPGDYYLTDRETRNLTAVAAAFPHTVVVLNTCVIDMNFLHQIPGIDAALYIGLGGMEAGNALADVLTGQVDPSGRLTDTLAKRYEDYPTAGHFADQDGSQLHPLYREGIYVGYRYFDSFGVEPLYPFGYGQSYGAYRMECLDAAADWKAVTLRVRVTNIGQHAGRQVVQLYASAPAGRLDKPFQELKAFGKTRRLQPGESQDLSLRLATESLASFDSAASAWVMEPGDYLLRVGAHSRDTFVAATLSLDGEAVTRQVTDCLALEEPLEELRAPGRQAEPAQGIRLQLQAKDCVTVDNRSRQPHTVTTWVPQGTTYFSAVNDNPYHTPNYCPEVTQPVRNCPNSTLYDVRAGRVTMPEFVASLPDEVLVRICTGILEETKYPIPARTQYKLRPGKGARSSGNTTAQYEKSLGIPSASLFDGPAGMHAIGRAAGAFPVGMVLAQTWDPALQKQVGMAFAREMAEFHVTIVLGPGMNIHRDPLGGRSFEYYAEDPFLSGVTASAFTLGVQADGRHGVAIKHFAANNQETQRAQAQNVVSPRALREIYLKGFEIAVRTARPMTVMTAYNGINGTNTSSRRDLITDVLRGEWGFSGYVMTDWNSRSDKVLDLQAGNDLIMGGYRAEKLLDAMVHKLPVFTADGAVEEQVKNLYGGVIKTTLTQWGSFVPQAGGPDTVTTRVARNKKLHPRVEQAVKDGTAKVEKQPDGSKLVTYFGIDRGACLARGTLQACAARILEGLLHSAAMDDLLRRIRP